MDARERRELDRWLTTEPDWDEVEIDERGTPVRDDRLCPDGGTCHHQCNLGECWRVKGAGPLSGVYEGDEWPLRVRVAFGETLWLACSGCGEAPVKAPETLCGDCRGEADPGPQDKDEPPPPRRITGEPPGWEGTRASFEHSIAGMAPAGIHDPDECPAGGEHTPTDAVGPEHEHLRAEQRWHCDECGVSLPAPQREEP